MDEFKIGDNVEEQNSEVVLNRLKKKRKIAIIIVVIISILIGLTTFLVSNLIFNREQPPEVVDYSVDLKDENVQILYQYVTYGTKGLRNDKFAKEDKVVLDNFSNEEKFYYALQFAQVDDFVFTGEINEEKNKVYLITDKKIKKYMQLFFGPNVKYKNDLSLAYPFSFRINGMNVGEMKYSENRGGFETTFTTFQADIKKEDITNNIEGELLNAYSDAKNKLYLEEKVVYITQTKNPDNTYKIDIYKDNNKTILVDTKTVSNLEEKIDLSQYNNTTTIKYTFGLNGSIYYFESSEMLK